MQIIDMVMQCLNFFQQAFLPTFLPKECDLNKHTNNKSKGCLLKGDLEYPNEL